MRISQSEFNGRCQHLLDYIQQQKLTGTVLFDSVNILYFTGFAFIPTERPIAFVLSAAGKRAMLVPRLEVEHAQAEAELDRVAHYLEYPGDPHPMAIFQDLLTEMGLIKENTNPKFLHTPTKPAEIVIRPHQEPSMQYPLASSSQIGADHDGYPWIFGYEGVSLSRLTSMTVQNVQGQLNRMQILKSPGEIALIKESCKWGHLAHVLQRYTAVHARNGRQPVRQPGSHSSYDGCDWAIVSRPKHVAQRPDGWLWGPDWAQRGYSPCAGQ